MFPNAKNPQFHGGQFIVVNGNTINQPPPQSALDLLRIHCALGALLDAKERFDPPRCSEETRKEIIRKALDWVISDDDLASILWLYGAAGAGKSALGQTIAEICRKRGHLLATFFFSRTASTTYRNDGDRLIPTLVYQILQEFPEMRRSVKEYISQDPALERSRVTQMDELFIKPLVNYLKPKRKILQRIKDFLKLSSKSPILGNPQRQQMRLIVIDGLDECQDPAVQVDLLKILAAAIPRLPFPLRFLIASRPESHISQTFDFDPAFQCIDVQRIDLGDDPNANDDIRTFLRKGFEEIHRTHPLREQLSKFWPSDDTITRLVQKASTQFIFASTVIRYVKAPRADPESRLQVVLGLMVPPSKDRPFAALDALYMHIFSSVEEEDRQNVNKVFGIMFLATQPKYGFLQELTSLNTLEAILKMPPGGMYILLDCLLSIVTPPRHRAARIKVLHASLFDFLLDTSRSGDLTLDFGLAHEALAQYYLGETLTYTPSSVQVGLNAVKDAHIHSCYRFLLHCESAYLSDTLKGYLCSFKFLYDMILNPTILSKSAILTSYGRPYTFVILQIFFNLLSRKDFEDGEKWHSFHTKKVEEQLMEGRMRDAITTPRFNNPIYRGRHRVYEALSAKLLDTSAVRSGVASVSEVLASILTQDGMEPEADANLQKHLLVIFIPRFRSGNDVRICTGFAGLRRTFIVGDELDEVLRQRLVKYLQRVQADTLTEDSSLCKLAWGI